VCGAGCCPEGKVCGSNGACIDPRCWSTTATCGAITTANLCCVTPRSAFCCPERPAGAQNVYMLCCNSSTGEFPDNCTSGFVQAGVNNGPPYANGVCE
jgi:hypothetical protein